MEDKLSALLANPQLMQQIMNMAQSLGQPAASPAPPPPKQEPPPTVPPMPDIDPSVIGKIMNLAGSTAIDHNQKTLLQALKPYLTQQRLQKLEKAMRAARLASAASSLLQSGVIPFSSGR